MCLSLQFSFEYIYYSPVSLGLSTNLYGTQNIVSASVAEIKLQLTMLSEMYMYPGKPNTLKNIHGYISETVNSTLEIFISHLAYSFLKGKNLLFNENVFFPLRKASTR